MKIFIINLEKDKQRFENISEQLLSNNFSNFERVDAIYGKDVYSNYKTKLRPSQLGIYLSFLKTCKKILEQDLEYGIVLEDDVTITEWFSRLEEIINTLPKTFDVCWIGNARGHFIRNACSLIPSYEYDKISKFRINDFVYKVDYLNVENYNYPVGCYGLVVSKKGAQKILNEINHYIFPVDMYLVKNINLEKYMTVPSIITHCYNFGSNINPQPVHLKKNPFENIWNLHKKQELEILEVLQNFTNIMQENNINYSLIDGTLLGFARNKKFISYDDDIDVTINIKDVQKLEKLFLEMKKFCNIFKYKKPKLNNSLYYKLYPLKNTIDIKNHKYKWPFIDIFVYKTINGKMYSIEKKKQIDIKEDFIYDYIKSHNNQNQYKVQIFKDYEFYLNKMFKNWDSVCLSSEWSHIKEQPNLQMYEFNCYNIIPDYNRKNINKKHKYKMKINSLFVIYHYRYFIIFAILCMFLLMRNRL